MDDKPTITAALRDAVHRFPSFHSDEVYIKERTFTDICDAIDSIHGRVCSERESALVELDRLQGECDHDGWMELPKDADGVPIHVGDMLHCSANGYEGTFSVFAIGNSSVVGNHDEEFFHKHPMQTFHVAKYCHHAPTVEDVLREFAQEMNVNLDMYTSEAIEADEWRHADEKTIAEYAAKLRLAGDGDE